MCARVHAKVRGGRTAAASSRLARGFALAGLVCGFAAAAPALADGPRGGTGEPLPFAPVGNALTANNAAVSDLFGQSVAISGEIAVVGAWLEDNDHGLNAGSAYVYRWTGEAWLQIAKLMAPDGATDDRFGKAVAVFNDLIVVGAPHADVNRRSDTGAAYVFRRDGNIWNFEGKLIASDPAAIDFFGLSVAASEAGIAIGAPREDRAGGLDQGAVYTYSYTGDSWIQRNKLIASKPGNNDQFGFHISMEGTILAVGTQYDDTGEIDAGSVSIFNYLNSQWTETQVVRAADRGFGANFGSSVDISGELMVVGAERDTTPGVGRTGSAYVFVRDINNRWNQTAKILSTAAAAEDFFGSSVGVSGKTIVIAAEKADLDGLVDSGSVQAFEYADSPALWTPGAAFNAGLGQGSEFFGVDLAFAHGLLVVAAPWVDLPEIADAGAAFAFAQEHDCNGDGLGDVSQIALGELFDINANGIPDLCECLADWDLNGAVSSTDVGSFVNDWFMDQANGTLNADVNSNGVTNTTDVSDFVNSYFDGCL